MKKSGINKIFTNSKLFPSKIILLLFIMWLVLFVNNRWLDEQVPIFFLSLISNTTTAFMKAITFLGNHKFLIPANLLLITALLFNKKRKEAILVTIVAVTSLGLMSLLKNIFQRTRPENPMVEGITNYSFPSGHAFMSVAFFGLLLYFIPAYFKVKWQRLLLSVLLIVLLVFIGVSRIYLNVHYATDVIAGWYLGYCWLIFLIAIFIKYFRGKTISDN